VEPAPPETTDEARRARVKISFFGHFGTPNTGNESTLLAILSRLRSIFPDAEFCCICTFPQSVTLRNGIDAVPISTRTVRLWDRDRPLYMRLAMAPFGIALELGQWIRAFRMLKGSAMLVVPGTGLLTDAFVEDWRPYNVMKWSVAARLRGCKVLFLSVGVGPLYSRKGRRFVRSAHALADYRSFRDRSSVSCVERIGFRDKRTHIYPDLAFSLPEDILFRSVRPEEGRRRVVGLGLMEYAGRYSVEDPRAETSSEYLEALVNLVEWLLVRDYDVSLMLGDGDTTVVDSFTALLRERVAIYSPQRVFYRQIDTVEEILSAIAATDIVVATRFHNVLLSLLLNKPVIAISFHHKCTSLMNEMGLSEYCHDIGHMNASKLIEQFQDLEKHSSEVKEIIRESVEAQRRALDEQYSLLFDRR
jgi:polysaccharide pyruvyl transferase WcaK-like protein